MTTTKHKMESYSAESFEARKNPDRSLRRVIDLEIRHFFQCLDMDHRDGLARHLADGAILIDLQYFPDEVLVSEKAVVENLSPQENAEMADSKQDALVIFINEVNSKMRDLPMRQFTEGKIRHFFKCFDDADWEGMKTHLRADVRLVASLGSPDGIHDGIDRTVEWFLRNRGPDQHTAHQLLLVDRGRVTCCTTEFWAARDGLSSVYPRFCEQRVVYVIELDPEQNIRRIELREHTQGAVVDRDGGLGAMMKAVEEAKKRAVVMKGLF
ncbi:hypothetical protein LX36DRAFT_713436 [Colletotrichum falcatum]|nr:hypothetical protein LX36DRAFT_713436 [Colletotrichum falcatum]